MANLRLTGRVEISVANDRVQLLLQTADDDDVELERFECTDACGGARRGLRFAVAARQNGPDRGTDTVVIVDHEHTQRRLR